MHIVQFDGQYQEHALQDTQRMRASLMGYGWLIYRNDQQLARGWGAFAQGKDAASNIAEYLALIEGLEALADMRLKIEHIEIRGDARSVLDQMSGLAPVHSQPTLPYYQRAVRLAAAFRHLDWVWIPRRNNRKADLLSRQAIRQMHRMPGAYQRAISSIVPGWSKLKPIFDLRIYQQLD